MLNDIINIISAVGFPIFCCVYIMEKFVKELNEMRIAHKEEVKNLSDTLNQNTLVIQMLIDEMKKD